jgi:alpha-D-ribose 1-methylphosphonate 5-triphosphate synthase subunit PhnG
VTHADRARDLQHLVASVSEAAARHALDALDLTGIELSRPPRSGLAMLGSRDPFDTTFCLGEVLVTEATVRAGQVRGWGVVVGEAPERGLLSAVVDLLGRQDAEDPLLRLEAWLAPERLRLAAERREAERLVASTRVQFDLMPRP